MPDIPLDKILQQEGVLNENLEHPKTDEEALELAEKSKSDKERRWHIQNYVRGYIDKHDLAKQLHRVMPYFYDESKNWWLWVHEKYAWKIVDDVQLLLLVKKLCSVSTTKSSERNEILEAMRQHGRDTKPQKIEKTWVQFKDKIVDVKTLKQFDASPKYFVTNPIPHELHKKKYVATPTIDKIFEEWVGKEHVKTLYEIISYCLLPDYPIHRLFCLIGSGLNGKSCFLRLLNNFIGDDNVTSTELDTLLSSRFEITKLHKKLVCLMGETNFSEISRTSIIKKLTGQDVIGFEYKNKNPFDETNYAKIFIATNNLPSTTDKTIGFYRRWLIIDFPNRFSEEKDIISEIPQEEYETLAWKSFMILNELLKNRRFHKEGSISDREKKYEEKSDPLEKFIKEFTNITDPNGFIPKWEFEKTLNDWLVENRHRKMADRTIAKKMRDHGVEVGRAYVDWYGDNEQTKKQVRVWLGIKWREKENSHVK